MSADNLKEEKATLRAMASIGCDREMAAKTVGWTVSQLRQVLGDDPEFAQVLLRAEGQAEFQRMRILHNAIKEERNWRAATWWLERRAQNRYSRRMSRNVTTTEIQEFIDELVEMVFGAVTREADRERLVTCLAAFAQAWEHDATGPVVEPLLLEKADDTETSGEPSA